MEAYPQATNQKEQIKNAQVAFILGIIGLVLGVFTFFCGFFGFVPAFICSLIAMILGIMGGGEARNFSEKYDENSIKRSKHGMIMGIIGMILSVVALVVAIALMIFMQAGGRMAPFIYSTF